METILNHIADLFFWGSVAAISWGAALAIGHSLASIDVRGPASAPRPEKKHKRGFLGGALALAFAVCLAAPGSAAAQDDYDRALEAIDGWNYAAALEPLRAAAARGDARAQEQLGMLLLYAGTLEGAGVRGDAREGIDWLRRAAAQGSEVAGFIVGRIDRRAPKLASAPGITD